jgi:hypothetical protein
MEGGIGEIPECAIPLICAADNDNDLMTFPCQGAGQMTSDESCSSGDGDFHSESF